jgi:uncharacterized Zn finger protein
VNLTAVGNGTCTCPHSTLRGAKDCKHRRAARLQAFRDARERAEKLSVDELKCVLLFKEHRPEVEEAIERVVWEKERNETLAQSRHF